MLLQPPPLVVAASFSVTVASTGLLHDQADDVGPFRCFLARQCDPTSIGCNPAQWDNCPTSATTAAATSSNAPAIPSTPPSMDCVGDECFITTVTYTNLASGLYHLTVASTDASGNVDVGRAATINIAVGTIAHVWRRPDCMC